MVYWLQIREHTSPDDRVTNPNQPVGPTTQVKRARYIVPLVVFVVMLGSTLGAYVLLNTQLSIRLDIALHGWLSRAFLLLGALICSAVLYLLLRFTNRYERLLSELAAAHSQMDRQSEELARRNVTLETKSTQEEQTISGKVLELEQSRTAMLSVLEDLTETRDALEQAHVLDAAVLASMADGVIVIDGDQRVTLINTAAERMMGYSLSEVVGQRLDKLPGITDKEGNVAEHEQRPMVRALQLGPSGGVVVEKSRYFRRKDGSLFPFEMEASPIVLNGRVTGAIAVFRDVTEQRRIDLAKNEFVSLASHQLRTPLTAIGWYSELLLTDDRAKFSAEQRDYLDEIHNANRRMIDLVDSLLNVSRIEMGSIRIEPEPINLEVFIHGEISGLAPLIRARNITIQSDIPPGLPTYLADPKLLTIIVQNLLSNAVKYTQANGTVQVRVSVDDGSYALVVTDNGMGIPHEQQGRIFTKLYRADNARLQDTEGSGLGLYLVKAIVEQIGGRISFTSTEGKGTTFTILLPRGGMPQQSGQQPVIEHMERGVVGRP